MAARQPPARAPGSKVDFNALKVPNNYVPGLGRGAAGFTTRSDIGPSILCYLRDSSEQGVTSAPSMARPGAALDNAFAVQMAPQGQFLCVKVIDMSQGASKDRFEMPKASVTRTPSGSVVQLGMHPRPSLRVIRWGFEEARAQDCLADEARAESRLSGRRHEAAWRYQAALAAAEARSGVEATKERGVQRCRGTEFSHLQRSTGILLWTTPAKAAPRGGDPRPATAPPAADAGWDVCGNQRPCTATSLRFAARTTFDRRRASVVDGEAVKKEGYLRAHAERRAAEARRRASEERLAREWPHGLPVGELRKARLAGLAAAPVGYGAPLSLPQAQYLALRPLMKWY